MKFSEIGESNNPSSLPLDRRPTFLKRYGKELSANFKRWINSRSIDMETSSILIGLLLFTGSIAYVVLPFRQNRRKTVTPSKGQTQQVGKRDVVLAALRDLDFDFKTGKVSEEDYQPVRNKLMVEAAQYLEQEDKEAERLEALIQSRRKAQQEGTKKLSQKPLRAYNFYADKG